MNESAHDGNLGAVYSAKQPEEIADIYDRWAETYDSDMSVAGYRHPSICLALLTRNLPNGCEPILDAGAGTGLMGEWLNIMGYPRLEALDISEGMLAVAKRKGVYSAFHHLPLGSKMPIESNVYAGIVSAGVFTTGHVGCEGIDELVRICQPNGIIVLTVKESLWNAEFADHITALEEGGVISLVDQTPPYISMPGEEGTKPSRGIVMRVHR